MPTIKNTRRSVWIGRAASALVVVALLLDGATQLFAPVPSMLHETGFAMELAPTLGWIMLVCAVLYAIPASSVFGAILVTGFLGGSICAHVRIGELGSPPEIVSVVLGVLTWGGLYLRDPRIRALLPLRR